ncbi:N-formylglutamate amidohydrolase [Cesiribacter sp. SM1]|uniref:N-formylglutamate amidohydrolase n=1 Tax=Cesiribacter sp. SM1 TaxID=2861196 RepID=UPI001CD7FE7C|nr:N-formylglutamate amidohydrolase [Cesiribacter sp. SM1]
MSKPFFEIVGGEGPLVVTAIHDGHHIRPVLNAYIGLSAKQRLREEDPHTGKLASLFPDHIVANYSRFETDLNRSRNKAVYLKPEDAWGLHVWRESLPKDEVEVSLKNYDLFYKAVESYLLDIINRHGFVVIYDLHTYNHRRGGPQSTPADPAQNPEINIGLGNINKGTWRPVIDTFTNCFKSAYPAGEEPDIRENVKFEGGHFMHWVHERFGRKACAISIEFKKTFMDEWTNEVDQAHLNRLGEALKSTEAEVIDRARLLFSKPIQNDRSSKRTDTEISTQDKERRGHT